ADEPSEGDLADLRETELAIATADWSCYEEIDYRQRELQVQFKLEQQFVDEWESDIDALMAAYNEQTS
ncbi:MAG: hypothetical protein ACK5KU_10300, partial [Beutenbergiaceae bacterium]